MKRIDAYLFFDNKCREAMTFYQECLGGELFIQTVAESPMAEQFPDMGSTVMHASLTHGDLTLMASDSMGYPIKEGSAVTLSLGCSSEEELHSVYAKLSAGGTQTSLPKLESWGDVFGMLTDKYGINWMTVYNPNK
jgi:PhnB protein